MNLLTVHRVLIAMFLFMSVVLLVWGIRTSTTSVIVLGAVGAPASALYLIKLLRNPPITK